MVASGRFLVSSVLWGRVWLVRGRVLAPSAPFQLAVLMGVGLRRLHAPTGFCAIGAVLVAAWGTSTACRMDQARGAGSRGGGVRGGSKALHVVPLRRPSRGLHLAGGDPKHRRCLKQLSPPRSWLGLGLVGGFSPRRLWWPPPPRRRCGVEIGGWCRPSRRLCWRLGVWPSAWGFGRWGGLAVAVVSGS